MIRVVIIFFLVRARSVRPCACVIVVLVHFVVIFSTPGVWLLCLKANDPRLLHMMPLLQMMLESTGFGFALVTDVSEQPSALNNVFRHSSCRCRSYPCAPPVVFTQKHLGTRPPPPPPKSCAVENATILSTAEEPSRVTCGSSVTSSLLQHGVTVDRGCIVNDSLLMEHSHVDNHGKVIGWFFC